MNTVTSFTRRQDGSFAVTGTFQFNGETCSATLALDGYAGRYVVIGHKGTSSIGAWGVPQNLKFWEVMSKVRTLKGAQRVFNAKRCYNDLETLALIAVTTARGL